MGKDAWQNAPGESSPWHTMPYFHTEIILTWMTYPPESSARVEKSK